MSNPKITVLIPFHKGLSDLEECLSSLFKSDYPAFEAVIIDNGSDERDLKEAAGRLSPRIKILREEKNTGFAGAVNRGIEFSKDSSDLFWIVNSDAIVERVSMSSLVEAFREDVSIAIAGSKVYFYYDKDILSGCGGFIDWRNLSCHHRGCGEKDLGQYDLTEDVDYVPGVSLMVKKEAIEGIGYFDEKFFMYFEDVEICIRAKKKGYRIVYVPSSIVFHKERSFEKKSGHSKLFSYYIARNSLYFFKAYGKLSPFSFIRWILINMRSNALSPARLWHSFRGVIDFFLGKSGVSHVG